jgi:TonB family protein
MKKSSFISNLAVALIAMVFGTAPSFASSNANRGDPNASKGKSAFTEANDSVFIDESSAKMEDLVLLAEPFRGVDMPTYLKENVTYPESAVERDVEGYVLVSFTVEKDGSLTNIKALKGNDADLINEVVKALGKTRMQPLIQNGYPARYSVTVPVKFDIID